MAETEAALDERPSPCDKTTYLFAFLYYFPTKNEDRFCDPPRTYAPYGIMCAERLSEALLLFCSRLRGCSGASRWVDLAWPCLSRILVADGADLAFGEAGAPSDEEA